MPVAKRIMTSRTAIAVRATMERATRSTLSSVAEYTPLLGRAAQRRRQRIVLPPYTRVHTVRGPILKTIAVAVLMFACIVYGFFFALWALYIMVPFVVPIIAVFAMVI